ncbi:MAG: PhnD/SsuA/transferrin family substrate-binding protein [Gammaproteobacteria bacterium]|nr:MAG: PhnD/SsuA/transferrin family substrate-binding protein [Gammaproteobacteria bacterium]
MNGEYFIACGMYAFDQTLQRAWQQLFDRFGPLIEAEVSLKPELVFACGDSDLRDPALFLGQTCGYPLMTRLRDALSPVCVPCFDVPGTNGKLYSSCFIVPASSTIETLQHCRGKVVAINTEDSNSGMNLLRHALARCGAKPHYFNAVQLTGSHHASVEAVAADRAQLAAIDCVSYQFIADREPALAAAVRVIGFSEQTCGLPFVMPMKRHSARLGEACVDALNQALEEMSATERKRLHLQRFESVNLADYRSILEFESAAIETGYAQLN